VRPNSCKEQINRRIEGRAAVIDVKTYRFEVRDCLISSPPGRHPFIKLKINLPIRIRVIQSKDLGSGQSEIFPLGVHPVSNSGKELSVKDRQRTNLSATYLGNAGIAGANWK
jgi:hypothetical protein